MEALFLKLLNMSIEAGWMIAAVLVLRFLLRKAPKSVRCILWALAGIRLVCPFSIESALSLVPSADPVPREILTAERPAIESGIGIVNDAVNPVIARSFAPDPSASVNPMQIAVAVAAWVWAAGMTVMLVYGLVSSIRLYRQVAVSMRRSGADENIRIGDGVKSPFILGLLRPRIYLPSALEESQAACIIAHEKAHLKRGDHWWKLLGYLLLSVYWFQPLCWAAYLLLCRDIELACDERVVKGMSNAEKKQYAQVLLACGVSGHAMLSACPLAFGETGIKQRVRSVLYYKKPTFWILLAAIAACTAAAVCFLTDPVKEDGKEIFGKRYSVSEVLYDVPWMDAAYTPESAPEYVYTEDRYLLQRSYGGVLGYNEVWNMTGVFREVETGGAGFLLSENGELSVHLQSRGTFSEVEGVPEEIPGLDGEARELLDQVERIWRVDGSEGMFYLIMQTRNRQVLQAACYETTDGGTYIRWLWRMEGQPAEGDTEYYVAMIEAMCGDDVQIFALYESDTMPDNLLAGFQYGGRGNGYALLRRDKTSGGLKVYGYAEMGGDALSCATLGEDWGLEQSVTVVLSSRGDLAYVTARAGGRDGQKKSAGVNCVPAMCVFEWDRLLSEEEEAALEVRFYGAQDNELQERAAGTAPETAAGISEDSVRYTAPEVHDAEDAEPAGQAVRHAESTESAGHEEGTEPAGLMVDHPDAFVPAEPEPGSSSSADREDRSARQSVGGEISKDDFAVTIGSLKVSLYDKKGDIRDKMLETRLNYEEYAARSGEKIDYDTEYGEPSYYVINDSLQVFFEDGICVRMRFLNEIPRTAREICAGDTASRVKERYGDPDEMHTYTYKALYDVYRYSYDSGICEFGVQRENSDTIYNIDIYAPDQYPIYDYGEELVE